MINDFNIFIELLSEGKSGVGSDDTILPSRLSRQKIRGQLFVLKHF